MSSTAPKFHKELKDLSVPEGECTVLECRLKANPPAKVVWMREGDLVEDSPDFRILHRGEIATLVIGSAYAEDSGKFECVATNSAGSATSSCILTVTGGGYYSVSTRTPSATTRVVLEKQRVKPAAAALSYDANHNDVENKPSSDPSQSADDQDGGPRDYIFSPRYDGKGEPPQEYRVSNFEQRLINEIEYRLERTPPVNEDPQDGVFEEVATDEQKQPSFESVIGSFKILVGSQMKFTCQVAGTPKPKVYWFKDGKQISKRSQHYLTTKEQDGVFVLFIPRVCYEDDGNYTALALNPKGRCSCTGRLAVMTGKDPTELQPPPQRSPMRIQEKGKLADDEESAVEKCFRPVFVQRSGGIEVDEGKLARLDVKVTGLPAPELEWLINGQPLCQDQYHRIIVRENNVHSLLIEPVSAMDEGQYSVVASNKAGRATVHMQLRVRPKEQTTVPVFVERLISQVSAEGGSVRLEARVIGKPLPRICWKKGSDQVRNTDRIQIIQDDTGYVCLSITEATRRDSDWYTCSATNKAGIVCCNCKLDIYSPTLEDAPDERRRIRTPHRYANLVKTAGIDMREAITPDLSARPSSQLAESEDL